MSPDTITTALMTVARQHFSRLGNNVDVQARAAGHSLELSALADASSAMNACTIKPV